MTAFNFPAAVWAWNAAIALVCGDPVIWKPSDKTSLVAIACDGLLRSAAVPMGLPEDVSPGRARRSGAGAGVGR